MPKTSPEHIEAHRADGKAGPAARHPGGLLCVSISALALFLAWLLIWSDETPPHGSDRTAGQPEKLPEINVIPFDGAPAKLSALHRNKVVILNIWATWCPPCRAELPSLQHLSDTLNPERFVVVGVSVDDDADFVREYLNDIDIRFPNYLATESEQLAEDLKAASFPHTLLVSTDRSIVARVIGARDWAASDQRRRVLSLWSPTDAN